jgi:uncharacterized repeat protein (TIGR02543 family)
MKENHVTVKDWGLTAGNGSFNLIDWQNASLVYKKDNEIKYDEKYKYFYTFTLGNIKVPTQSSTSLKSYLWLRWYRFNLSFNSNGGSAVNSINNIPYKVSTGVEDSNGYLTYAENTVALPSPTRTGYTFSGWARSGGSSSLNGSVKSSVIGVNSDGENITLTAKWTANKYTVTFKASGGSVTPSSKSVTYDSTYGDLPTPTRAGYTFNGWYTAASGGTKVTASTTVAITSAQTLYAQWTANTYTVTFDANGGQGGKIEVLDFGTALSAPTVTRTGHTFAGWVPDVLSTVPAEDVTYVAQWTVNTYTVTFDAGDDAGQSTSKTVTYGSVYGELPVPERSGYVFKGWFTQPGGKGIRITETTEVSLAENHTLYAHWIDHSQTLCRVEFYPAGGHFSTSASYARTMTAGEAYGDSLPTPSAQGSSYEFLAWYDNPGYQGSAVTRASTVPEAASAVLYAQWRRKS